jgi:hypothetical protein
MTYLSDLVADEPTRGHGKNVVEFFQRVAARVRDEEEHQDEDAHVHAADGNGTHGWLVRYSHSLGCLALKMVSGEGKGRERKWSQIG